MTLGSPIEISALSDVGITRTKNEDSIGAQAQSGLVVVADGMGGYKGGEVASSVAINTILGELEACISSRHAENPHDDHDSGFTVYSLGVLDVIKRANQIIYQTAQSQPQYVGMGTTVVMALFYDNRLTIAHVGDSRLYRFRDDKLELITQDHTLLQELIARGVYNTAEAKESQNKNLVTRALGIQADIEVDIQEDIVLAEDIYILCSDGLNDMVDDQAIYLTLKMYNDNLDQAVATLVKLANDEGGKDNISVILARPKRITSSRKGWIDKMVDWFF